jgi:hypothetical protein
MAVPNKRGSLFAVIFILALSASGLSARADEIRLKSGRILNGVIVGYEDDMFRVKTADGFELVRKDKIESITPSTPAAKSEAATAAKKEATSPPSKTEGGAPTAQTEPAAAASSDPAATAANAGTKPASASTAAKTEKTAPKITNVAVKPEVPASTTSGNVAAPAIKATAATTTSALAPAAAAPAPPKEPELPANKEEIQGNLYTNYTHGFRMYKAPSWSLIEEARGALPNAIVAMGTSNESTLLVLGEEKTKEPLDVAAAAVEKRLHDVYANYQRLSERKSVVGGMPAVEYKYRGKADDHDWSGRLVVVARGKDMFTVLAMTYADSDLIQIQENVIARAIASLDFSAH